MITDVTFRFSVYIYFVEAMKLKLFYHGLIFLVFFTFIQCQDQEKNIEIKKIESLKASHNVLQNGRIISKPVSYLIFIFMYISILSLSRLFNRYLSIKYNNLNYNKMIPIVINRNILLTVIFLFHLKKSNFLVLNGRFINDKYVFALM
jgi:hypothetical protein